MARPLEVCICGGGHLAHALTAVIGANRDVAVRVLTRRPELWDAQVEAVYDNLVVIGRPRLVTSSPAAAAADCDLVLVAVPAFAHCAVLGAIAPFISPRTWVGALPAPGFFDWAAASILPAGTPIFGAQRSPYNCRIKVPGRQVEILGIVPRLPVAALPNRRFGDLAALIAATMAFPVEMLDNFLCVTLGPSSTIFHPARLFSFFDGRDDSAHVEDTPLFYQDWDDAASRVYLACDRELQSVCEALPIKMSGVVPACAHYGVSSPSALTARIRNLPGLRGIPLPMQRTRNGYAPDWHSRFFTEDFPFGLRAVRLVAALAKVETPLLDTIDAWSQHPPITAATARVEPDCGARLQGCSLADIVRRATS